LNRKKFIESTLLGTVGLGLIPKVMQYNLLNDISYQELIGKGNPVLYGTDYKIRSEAYLAFKKMVSSAKISGIQIQSVSSYRSFKRQNQIWKRKFLSNQQKGLSPSNNVKKIIEYSTIPGTSRHHWGTDLDLIDISVDRPASVLQPKHFEDGGCFRKFKLWMDQNANRYGFHLVYTDTKNRKGFKYEPWHYSYKPLSSEYLKAYRKLDLNTLINSENIEGNQYFTKNFIADYIQYNILEINPELL